MAKHSAGLLLYRWSIGRLEVFLVHPGGPFWVRRDTGAWSIPKGEVDPSEDALAAAKREFTEETGLGVKGEFLALAPLKQPSGKIVHAWAVEADCDAAAIRSNTFTMEWPPRSGKMQQVAEVDRAEWFDIETARRKLHRGQIGFLDELERRLC
ncbi:MAG: NUDIX domain-containing protein [Alphaproteobacteria bacterium]